MRVRYVFAIVCSIVSRLGGKCEVYQKAAITANGRGSAAVGRRIIERGGSVADAAIATMLCDGVTSSERMGIGGGFVMLIYSHATRTSDVLVAREVAPAAANRYMYANDTIYSLLGGLAVGVPAEIKGYWELHRKYGKISWGELFIPAIEMCYNGVEANDFVTRCRIEFERTVVGCPQIKEKFRDFCNSFSWRKSKMYRDNLATTLKKIAEEGPSALYDGELTENFLKDIKDHGGIITREDLINYQPKWTTPLKMKLSGGYEIHVGPPPSAGAILLLLLNVLTEVTPVKKEEEFWPRLIECLKYAYGYRSRLGDLGFSETVSQVLKELLSNRTAQHIRNKIRMLKNTSRNFADYGGVFISQENSGTAHLNFAHPNGDAIVVTSSINTLYGAMFCSQSTGIILNNCMNDFSVPGATNKYGLPPSPVNFIQPGKTPQSSKCPTIILDENGNIRMLIGAAGGTRIISSVFAVLFQHLWRGVKIEKAVNNFRLHHQLLPMKVFYERGFNQKVLQVLKELGHELEMIRPASAVSAICRSQEGLLHAVGDPRRNCSVDGF